MPRRQESASPGFYIPTILIINYLINLFNKYTMHASGIWSSLGCYLLSRFSECWIGLFLQWLKQFTVSTIYTWWTVIVLLWNFGGLKDVIPLLILQFLILVARFSFAWQQWHTYGGQPLWSFITSIPKIQIKLCIQWILLTVKPLFLYKSI